MSGLPARGLPNADNYKFNGFWILLASFIATIVDNRGLARASAGSTRTVSFWHQASYGREFCQSKIEAFALVSFSLSMWPLLRRRANKATGCAHMSFQFLAESQKPKSLGSVLLYSFTASCFPKWTPRTRSPSSALLPFLGGGFPY